MLCLLLAACPLSGRATSDAPAGPVVSPERVAWRAGFVGIRELVPDMRLDIRYAGRHNFVGRPIDGYEAANCLLLRPAAQALRRVERALRAQHRRLLVYDCYRPVRAVADFMRWARDPDALSGKAEFFPSLDKRDLVPQYIAEKSGHNRGATLDLTLLQCDDRGTACAPLDMGTGFDYFGERAHTDAPDASPAQRANRHALREAMAAGGFENYADEWWHYTLTPEPAPDRAYDFPVR